MASMTGFLWSDEADEFFQPPGKKPKPSGASKSAGKPEPTRPGASNESPLSVTQVNGWIKRTLEGAVPSFWMAGEIGNLMRSGAGHVYLTLKDNANQISAVIWRSTLERTQIKLAEGTSVVCFGKLDVYGPRGTYQLVIQRIEEQGIGALQAAFLRLHAKLKAEGLFEPERKKPLPKMPTRIGFVTSPQGAAIHDFLEVLKRRWPSTNVLIIPTRVQGEGAAREIAHGIQIAGRIRPQLDVLVVGRGGGSVEDLWCFNDEQVVRAVAACPIPTVSAVGHEIDVTLCDLAADVRALTPSEAAERVVPNRDELRDVIDSLSRRLDVLMSHQIAQRDARLNSLITRPVLANPSRMLDVQTQRIDEVERSIQNAIDRVFENRLQAFEKLSATLEAISPLKTLSRGYSLTTHTQTGRVIGSIEEAVVGDRVTTRLADGEFESTVLRFKALGQKMWHDAPPS
jgi:exodeoxyribonuclease VII large subunit